MSESVGCTPKKRKAIEIGTKVDIIRDIRSGIKNADVATKYGLSKSTISAIVKDEKKIMASADMNGDENHRKRLREATYKEVEDALYKWFLDARANNVPISGPLLIQKARGFAFLQNHPEFNPGGGWIQRFKERHGIVYKTIVGEGATVNVDMAESG